MSSDSSFIHTVLYNILCRNSCSTSTFAKPLQSIVRCHIETLKLMCFVRLFKVESLVILLIENVGVYLIFVQEPKMKMGTWFECTLTTNARILILFINYIWNNVNLFPLHGFATESSIRSVGFVHDFNILRSTFIQSDYNCKVVINNVSAGAWNYILAKFVLKLRSGRRQKTKDVRGIWFHVSLFCLGHDS
jgi:hypothetical protein